MAVPHVKKGREEFWPSLVAGWSRLIASGGKAFG